MKAIEKMVEYLRHKEATSVLFQSVWQDAKLEALRLAAEEKAGDEGLRQYLKREIHLLKTQSMDGPFQDGMKYAYENILSRQPVSEQKAPAGLVEEIRAIKEKHTSWRLPCPPLKKQRTRFVKSYTTSSLATAPAPTARRNWSRG